jgi:hypothetical protein
MSELLESQIPIARQVDFDAFVKDLMDSNALSIEDAAEEAVETFSSDYDISGLFIYRNKREFDEKVKVETRCKTIEKAGKGTDTFINANFAFQGLIKLLKDSDENVKEGMWHMFNSKRIVNSLIQLLIVQKTDDKKEEIGEIDSDSDEEDEDEAKVLQTVAVLDFLIFIIQSAFASSQYFQDLALFCALDEVRFCFFFSSCIMLMDSINCRKYQHS